MLYGLWYIVFVLGGIMILLPLISFIVQFAKVIKEYKRSAIYQYELYSRAQENKIEDKQKIDILKTQVFAIGFYNCYEKEEQPKTFKEFKKTHYTLANYLNRNFGFDMECLFASLIFLPFFVIVLFCAIFLPINANAKYIEFQETKIMVEQVYENATNTDNFAITQKVIDMNKWLAEAIASKETFGCFSSYCNIDLDNLEYIIITRE